MRRKNRTVVGAEWLLVKRGDRRHISIKYRADARSPWKWGSSGVPTKKEARKLAPRLVQLWLTDTGAEVHDWVSFRARYEAEHLPSLAAKTQEAFRTAANRLESLCTIRHVEDLDAEMFSQFAAKLRTERGTKKKPRKPKAESTIQAYRDHLMMALDWAKTIGLIDEKPQPPRIRRSRKESDKSRGRHLTREEAELITAKLPAVVGERAAARWAWNLEALWRSGMRIGETFSLTWDPSEVHYIKDLEGKRPMIVISADHEKGFRNRVVPMTPDFVMLLREIAVDQRKGRVFRWPGTKGPEVAVKTVEKRIAKAGREAKIVVGHRVDGTEQFATAHDFRRSFGARWAPKVMPIVLKDLMRHESIETTLKYYVGINAERHADALWSNLDTDFGAKLGAILDSPCVSEGIGEDGNTVNN